MSEAYVTLATNDSYAFGAATLAASLRRTGTTRAIVCLVTTGVSPLMRVCLERFFDRLVYVDVFDSKDQANLALLGRPELGCTFTKLSCWRLTEYSKAVFLDADTLVLKNIDDLFQREELSAAPDLGWPDCFNSGVFVFAPSNATYQRLIDFVSNQGSFDGGDQGLLNSYFSDWATKDIGRHLPYVYNTAFMAAPYSYLPALKHFFQNLKVIHFLGALKPWLLPTDASGNALIPPNLDMHDCSKQLVNTWWEIYNSEVKHRLAETYPATKGVHPSTEGSIFSVQAGAHGQSLSAEEEDRLHRAAWESGYVEFGGRDSFQNIKSHIETVMSKPGPTPSLPGSRPSSATTAAPAPAAAKAPAAAAAPAAAKAPAPATAKAPAPAAPAAAKAPAPAPAKPADPKKK